MFSLLSVLQGKGCDGGPGGESPAAADGDNSGDAGGSADGGDGSREENAGQLGRSEQCVWDIYTNNSAHDLLYIQICSIIYI